MERKAKKFVSTRRMGLPGSEIRARLVEAAAQIVQEEGCAAVSARRLAEKFGLKRQIVHYYFRSIEDLLIAVIRRDGERIHDYFFQAPESDNPLAMAPERSPKLTATILEFTALATRRKAVQVEVKRYVEKIRAVRADALAQYLKRRGVKPNIPPVAAIMALESVYQALSVEEALGVSEGHAEMKVVLEGWLRELAERGELCASPRKRTRTRRGSG